MAETLNLPRLTCQLNIIQLTNFNLNLAGSLFIRYYIFSSSGIRIRVDTREIASTNEPSWNELTSLECHSSSNQISVLIDPLRVVFELRWRRKKWLGTRSKLLGRGEAAWKDVVRSPDMELEKMVVFAMTRRWRSEMKAPALVVRMRVGGEVVRKEERRWKECECNECKWSGSEDDIFQAASLW